MNPDTEVNRIVQFAGNLIVPLSTVERTMVMPFDKRRHENIAEHANALAILGASLAPKYDPNMSVGLIVQYAIAHDVVEIHTGDVTVWEPDRAQDLKKKAEVLASERIARDFPDLPWVIEAYKSYEQLDTPEKCFVYALDKIYPHILILVGNHHPVHPSWEAYLRTERIARERINKYPGLLPLFDELCARFREKPHFFSTPIPKSVTGNDKGSEHGDLGN